MMSDQVDQLRITAQEHGESDEFITGRLNSQKMIDQLKLPRFQEYNLKNLSLISDSSRLGFESSQTTVKLSSKAKASGVILENIFDAEHDHRQLLKDNFMQIVRPDENKLLAFHRAYLNDGLLLYIPDNVAVEEPIIINQLINATGKSTISHLLIIAAPNSDVKIIQHLSSQGNQETMANLVVEIAAQEGAKVQFSGLDELGRAITTYYSRRANIASQAKVEWSMAMMNSGHTVGDMDAELQGDGGQADSKMIAITNDEQRVGINNRVIHHGKHTTGLINQRGVVLGKSELILNGIGQIVHGAHGSNAEQQNRLLMMSPNAHGDANPILLIDENDVEAGHAASVGQVNAQQLYYLMSRGIPKAVAQKMVIRGFLGAVLTAIPVKNVRKEMISILERKLKNVD